MICDDLPVDSLVVVHQHVADGRNRAPIHVSETVSSRVSRPPSGLAEDGEVPQNHLLVSVGFRQ